MQLKPSPSQFLRPYLNDAPMFMAMVRSVECALLRGAGPLAAPVIDIGCGDGLFGSLAFAAPPVAGFDPDPNILPECRNRESHRTLLCADATRMPFASGSIATAVANSVLEHIEDLDAAVAEIGRVLAPSGRLLITAPSHRFAASLLGSSLGAWYGEWFNRRSRHLHTDSIETWRTRLLHNGLHIEKAFYYLDRRAMRIFDACHYLSVGRLASRALFGRWMLFPNPLTNGALERWFQPHVDRALQTNEGAYLFIDARKT
jgi:SAM-dependent methyltransferase